MAQPNKKRARRSADFVYETRDTYDNIAELYADRFSGAVPPALQSSAGDELPSIVPDSGVGLLRKLSSQRIEDNPLSISSFAFAVTREAEAAAAAGELDARTTRRDLERLVRNIDDFVLQHRAGMDRLHRMTLWTAQCKVINLMQNTLLRPRAEDTSSEAAAARVGDELRRRSFDVDNAQLAKWMHDNDTCDRSALVFDRQAHCWRHLLQTCGVAALWASIRSLMSAWPYLPLSEYVYAQLDQLRQRVAFFFSYCETLDATTQLQLERRNREVLGLSIQRWRVVAVLPAKKAIEAGDDDDDDANDKAVGVRHAAGAATRYREPETKIKLNSTEFTQTITDKTSNVKSSHVNEDYIEETERVMNCMMIELRRCAGFEWHLAPAESRCDCLACEQLVDVEAMTDGTLNFDAFVGTEMNGPYRDFTQAEFRELAFEVYEQPSERELFATYNPHDKHNAQNFISRNRRADARTINKRLMSRNVTAVWETLQHGNRHDPAYALLATLSTNYYMQANCDGGLLKPYMNDTKGSEPFLYREERFGRFRNCHAEFHTPQVTTGSYKYRHHLIHRDGMSAAENEVYYEHPVIVKCMASFCVLYNDRMHFCQGGVGHAYALWIALMCEDVNLCGALRTGGSVFPIYKRLFPSRRAHIDQLEQRATLARERWDVACKLLNLRRFERAEAPGGSRAAIQF